MYAALSGSTYCSYQSGSPKCSIATIGKKTSAARAHQRQLSLDRRPKGRKGELSRQRENLKSSSRAGRGRIILGEGREGGGRRSVGIGGRLRDEGGGAGDGGMVRTVDGSRKGEGGGKESGGSRDRGKRALAADRAFRSAPRMPELSFSSFCSPRPDVDSARETSPWRIQQPWRQLRVQPPAPVESLAPAPIQQRVRSLPGAKFDGRWSHWVEGHGEKAVSLYRSLISPALTRTARSLHDRSSGTWMPPFSRRTLPVSHQRMQCTVSMRPSWLGLG